MASSHRSTESERTYSRTSFPYVHDKLCSKLRQKRRLRVQDRSAGCVLSCTDSSKQQEIPQVRLRKQGVPVSSTTFRSKYGPSSFMSPVPEPRALAVDALSQDWQGRSMYMFLPFPLLSKVVQKLRSTQVAEVILVAPWWPSQPWFPHLLRLCVEHPLFLPYRQDLLSQQDQKNISDRKSFHLHVWRLSCDTTKQQAFQTRSLGSRQLLGDPQPIACTTTNGVVSHDELRDKVLIHLTPQPLR